MTQRSRLARSSLDRTAIFGVPAIAGLAVAVTLVGGGRERPVLGARVYGVPVDAAGTLALRIETLRAERRLLRAAPNEPIRLQLRCGDERAAHWTGTTNEGGVADAALTAPKGGRWCSGGGPLELDVVMAGQTPTEEPHSAAAPLARGPIAWVAAPTPYVESPLDGSNEGPLPLHVSLPRGVAVSSLPERVEIVAPPAAPPASAAGGGGTDLGPGAGGAAGQGPMAPAKAAPDAPPFEVDVEVRGGALLGPVMHGAGGGGHRGERRWEAQIVGRAPPVELEVTVRMAGAAPSTWSGEVPVVLGWPWADEASLALGTLRVRSVAAQPVVYASLVGLAGRFWGATVALAPDVDGMSAGELALPELPDGPIELQLSSAPSEPEQGTARWPVRPELGRLTGAELRLLLDGMPRATSLEGMRQARARQPALAVVVAAGLFELAFLLRRYRKERRRAERALGPHGAAPSGNTAAIASFGPLWIGVLLGGVTLAFVALAALVLWG